MGRKGYLKFYRSMLDHQIWLSEPFTKGQAFWDIVAMANYAESELLFGNTIIQVDRGQLFTSDTKLSERWQWSRNKVRRYLQLLEQMKMCKSERTIFGTLITVENYSVYQYNETESDTGAEQGVEQKTEKNTQKNIKNDTSGDTAFETGLIVENSSFPQYEGTPYETSGETPSETPCETSSGTSSGTQKKKLKKNKELNNNKYIYGEYRNVKLSAEDMERLMKEFPADYGERIERLSEYMASSGRSYRNHLATIRAWSRRDGDHEGKHGYSKAESGTGRPAGTGDEYEKFFK